MTITVTTTRPVTRTVMAIGMEMQSSMRVANALVAIAGECHAVLIARAFLAGMPPKITAGLATMTQKTIAYGIAMVTGVVRPSRTIVGSASAGIPVGSLVYRTVPVPGEVMPLTMRAAAAWRPSVIAPVHVMVPQSTMTGAVA